MAPAAAGKCGKVGFDLACGAGHPGLQGAPGALPSALGFESHEKEFQMQSSPT